MNNMPIFGGPTTTPIRPSVGVDQVYNPGSENAQSGIALAGILFPDKTIWHYLNVF